MSRNAKSDHDGHRYYCEGCPECAIEADVAPVERFRKMEEGDPTRPRLKPGVRVRHPDYGVGTLEHMHVLQEGQFNRDASAVEFDQVCRPRPTIVPHDELETLAYDDCHNCGSKPQDHEPDRPPELWRCKLCEEAVRHFTHAL